MSLYEGHLGGWRSPTFANAASVPAPADHTRARSARFVDDTADYTSDQAITALVEQYAPALYRVAFSVVRNNAEAEDAVQETFLRVLRHRHKLPAILDIRVWLVRVTWNVVLDRKRRTKTRPETDNVDELAPILACREAGGEAVAIASERYLKLVQLIDTLPTKERQALLLSAVDELTTSEIAQVLRTSESSIRSRLFRARQMLGRLLAGPVAAPISSFTDEKRGHAEEDAS